MEQKTLLVSEKQLTAIEMFFNDETEDMQYGGAARWGKSETIGILLAIVISAFPWSAWLLARTVLADLKATTLATFYSVMKRFGYGENSYKDKIRDERHLSFVNDSKLFVIQVNQEPGDPEFDRIGSYWYTGWFLDEGQQMSNKVREVLQGRLSELDGSFQTEVPLEYENYTDKQLNPGWTITFKVVDKVLRLNEKEETEKNIIRYEKISHDYYNKDITFYPNGSAIDINLLKGTLETEKEHLLHIIWIENKKYKEVLVEDGRRHYITREVTLTIPYDLIKSEKVEGKLIHTYAWHFKGCIFTGCNPGTNFTRSDFYKPWKEKKLLPHMAFIPAKVGDNPWVDRKYVIRLERLPESSIRKQRLLYGNFDYDDNPGILYDQNTIEKMFTREPSWDRTRFLVIDAARQGKDATEIGLWEGLDLKEKWKIDKADLVEQGNFIQEKIDKYNVSINNTIVDEVWVGAWLVDFLGCIWFIGNSWPLQPYAAKLLTYKRRNYINLRTQAFYYLQRYMKMISIRTDQDTQDLITEELLTVKEINVVDATKLQIVKKSLMKEELGRSPDLADMISMRMWWIIKWHHDGTEDEVLDELQDKEETLASFIQWLIDEEEEKKEKTQFEPNFDIYG